MIGRQKIVGLLFLLLMAPGPSAAQKPAPENRARCLGSNPNAPIRIEVFSDYQCPHCRDFYLGTIRRVLADYAVPGKVCIVYYDFPLRTFKYSRQAARYAQAAARLGPETWIRVSDALYYYQSQWANDGQLETVVASALSKKEMEQVRRWLGDPKLETAIDRDVTQGNQRGIRSTPTFFITANGKTERQTGLVPYDILRRYLDHQLSQR